MDEQIEAISTRLKRQAQQACDQIVAGLDEELLAFHASKAQHYNDLKEQHTLVVESCEKLRTENVRLQDQLKELLERESNTKANKTPESTAKLETKRKRSSSHRIPSSIQSLIDENPELQAILDEQAANYKKLQAAHGVLLQKLKEHQEVIVQLQRENTKSEQLPGSKEERLAHLKSIISPARDNRSHPRGSSSRSPSILLPATTEYIEPLDEDLGPNIQPVSNKNREVVNLESSPIEIPVEESIEQEVAGPTVTVPTYSDWNNLPTTDVTPVNPTNNDSQPVFVSERPVKRRRTGHANNPYNRAIKSEFTMTGSDTAEESHSIDFDAVPAPIILPQIRPLQGRPLGMSSGVSKTNETTAKRHSEPPLKTRSISLDGNQESMMEVFIKNENGLRETERSRDDFIVPPPPPSSGNSYFQEKSQRNVLQPKPLNIRNTLAPDLSREKAILRVEQGIGSTKTNKTGNSHAPVSVTVPNSETSVSEGQPIETTPAKNNNTSPSTTGKYQTALQKKRGQAEQRLRDRNINELSLNDFILNPAMNQGFNQALGEIDTRKTGKRCPPECSKPECCGNAFANAVQRAGIASLQDLSPEEKNSLIESYLGFPVSTLGLLSNQGYQKLLGEAIGKQFAEKYGKYKQARSNSPPGYWRVEFPSTQERETDKRCAEQIEKATIAERRREALRSGGLWVFRDE